MNTFKSFLLLSLCLVGSLNQIIGQVCIDDPTFSDLGISTTNGLQECTAMAAADMDNDGDIDIVAAFEENGGRLVYYENDGNFNYTPSLIVGSNNGVVNHIALGDMNCDLLPEIALSNPTNKAVEVYLNKRGGTFTLQTAFTATNAHEVQIKDLDQNGTLDVIYAATDDAVVAVEYNDGAFNFDKLIIVINTAGVTTFDVGDLECDGDLDLMVGSPSTNTLYKAVNLGNSTVFATSVANSQADGINSLHWQDMDKDGDLDVVASLAANDQVVYFKQDVNNNFFSFNIIADNVNEVKSAIPVDLDGDGDQDVVVAGQKDQVLLTHINTGDHADFQQKVVARGIEGIFTAIPLDADLDGDVDIFVPNAPKEQFVYFKNDCTHCKTTQLPATTEIASNINGVRSATPIDWDKDGDLDIITLSSIDDIFYLLTNNGEQLFTRTTLLTLPATVSIGDFALGDMDNDGDVDIVGAEFNTSELFWYRNDGNNNFTYFEISDQARATDLYLMDFDKDGLLDILIPNQVTTPSPGSVVLYDNSQTQSFKRSILHPGPGVSDFDMADIDKDGDLDFVLVSLIGSDNFEWLEQTSPSTFTVHPLAMNVTRPEKTIAVDLDQDGDTDFVTLNDGSIIRWFDNDGNQNFTERALSSSYVDVNDIDVADIDNDGDMDVLIAKNPPNSAIWLKNDNMTFTESIISTVHNYQKLKLADLDLDGDVDILFEDFFADRLYWSENSCDFDCATDDMLVDNRIVPSGTYHGRNTLSSMNATVEEVVIFKAASDITLKTGFHAKVGSDFQALIDACPYSSVSTEPYSTVT